MSDHKFTGDRSDMAHRIKREMAKGSPTGRLPRDPNVQNIPVRTPQGRAIREAFTDKAK